MMKKLGKTSISQDLVSVFRDQEAGGSNPLAPTFCRNQPFGENVEGLSHCGSRSCGSIVAFKSNRVSIWFSRQFDATSFARGSSVVQIPLTKSRQAADGRIARWLKRSD